MAECEKMMSGESSELGNVSSNKRHSFLRRGDTCLSIDNSGIQRWLPHCIQFVFADQEAEKLYREYYKKEKRTDFRSALLVTALVDAVILALYGFVFDHSHHVPFLVALSAVLVVSVVLLIVVWRCLIPVAVWTVIPLVAWVLQATEILCHMWLYSSAPRLPTDSVSWVLLFTYAVYIWFPVRLGVSLSFGILLAGLQLLVTGIAPVHNTYVKNQLGANLLLYLCSNLLGLMSFFFIEKQQRRSFLETRQSLEAKLVLEEESQEQIQYRRIPLQTKCSIFSCPRDGRNLPTIDSCGPGLIRERPDFIMDTERLIHFLITGGGSYAESSNHNLCRAKLNIHISSS